MLNSVIGTIHGEMMMNALSTAARSASRRTLFVPCSPSSQALRTFTSTSLAFNKDPDASTAAAQEAQDQTQGEQKIREILTAKFNPSVLKVQDVSGGCGSFYAIQLTSKQFKGLSTVKAHRLVNQELKDVIKDIHGLQLRTVAED